MLYVSVKKRFALGCFGLFLFFAEAGYPISFSWPRCPERISRFVSPLLNGIPVANHMAAAVAGTFGSAAVSGMNRLSPGNLALLTLSQGSALLQQLGVREDAPAYRAARYCTRGVAAMGIFLPTIMAPTVSSAAVAAGMTTAFYLAQHFVTSMTRRLCSDFMPEVAQKYVEPWLLAAGQVAMAAIMPRQPQQPGEAIYRTVGAVSGYWPENLAEQSFWLASEENRYHCLAPDALANGAAVTAERFCTYQHLWFFHEGSLRPLARPDLCLEVAGGHRYEIPRLKPCALSVAAQQWDYDKACDTRQAGINPELLVVMNSNADAVISKNCYLFGIYPDKSGVQEQPIQDGEHLFSNKNTQWILYRILWQHRPKSGISSLSPVRYPIALSDFKALQTEYFRDFFNGIAFLNRLDPYPRYINHFPGNTTGSLWPNMSADIHFDCVGDQDDKNQYASERMERWTTFGLYAPAGEPVYVNVKSLDGTRLTPIGMRFGVHTADDLCFLNARNTGWLERPCRVSQVFSLHQGDNWLRSQYGGTVIIEFYRPMIDSRIVVSIKYVAEEPYFRPGVVTDWQTELQWAVAPWAELGGTYCSLHLPIAVARTVTDPEKLLAVYDRIVINCRWLAGMPALKIGKNRNGFYFSQHIVQDIIPVEPNTVRGGIPVTVDASWHITDLDQMNYWGIFCQLGHNFQPTPLAGAFDKSALAGLFALYNQEELGQDSRLLIERCYSQAIAKVSSGHMVLAEAEPLEQLVFLMQIKHFIAASSKGEEIGGSEEEKQKDDAGWLFYRKLNSYYQELSGANKKAIAASRQRQFDSFYTVASNLSGYDLREHFEAWKVPISDAVKYEIERQGLPLPSMPISEINQEHCR